MSGVRFFFMPLLAVLAVGSALAQSSPGLSTDMLCAVTHIVECSSDDECISGSAGDIYIPTFLRIDLDKKQIHTRDKAHLDQLTEIQSFTRLGERLLLQGVDGVRAWSAVISVNSGEMTATISDHDLAFVLFGECTVP